MNYADWYYVFDNTKVEVWSGYSRVWEI